MAPSPAVAHSRNPSSRSHPLRRALGRFLSHVLPPSVWPENGWRDEIAWHQDISSDTIYCLRYDTMRYTHVGPSVERLLGYNTEEMLGLSFRDLIVETRLIENGLQPVDSYQPLESRRKLGEVSKWQAEYRMRTKSGREIWVSDISHPWHDKRGRLIGSIGILRDITERVQAQPVLPTPRALTQTTKDQQTGLASRQAFFQLLEEWTLRMKDERRSLTLVLLDIDHFKRVNTAYGREFGDLVLSEMAKVLRGCLRESDIAARIGGEEFAVILPDSGRDSAYWVAERIRTTIASRTFTKGVGKAPLHCTVSIGLASQTEDHCEQASDLFNLADTRLYQAKHTGSNQVVAQTHGMHVH